MGRLSKKLLGSSPQRTLHYTLHTYTLVQHEKRLLFVFAQKMLPLTVHMMFRVRGCGRMDQPWTTRTGPLLDPLVAPALTAWWCTSQAGYHIGAMTTVSDRFLTSAKCNKRIENTCDYESEDNDQKGVYLWMRLLCWLIQTKYGKCFFLCLQAATIGCKTLVIMRVMIMLDMESIFCMYFCWLVQAWEIKLELVSVWAFLFLLICHTFATLWYKWIMTIC